MLRITQVLSSTNNILILSDPQRHFGERVHFIPCLRDKMNASDLAEHSHRPGERWCLYVLPEVFDDYKTLFTLHLLLGSFPNLKSIGSTGISYREATTLYTVNLHISPCRYTKKRTH